MPIPLSRILQALLTALVLIAGLGAARADVTVTDILGREVTLPAPARHIVLGEARHVRWQNRIFGAVFVTAGSMLAVSSRH